MKIKMNPIAELDKADITLALSDNFGFGGHNACLAFRKV